MGLQNARRRLRRESIARAERAAAASHDIASKIAEVAGTRYPRQFSELSAAFAVACAERFKPDIDPSRQIEQMLVQLGFQGVFLDSSSVVECTPLVSQPVFPSMDLTRFLLASLERLGRFTAARLVRGTPTGLVLHLYGPIS